MCIDKHAPRPWTQRKGVILDANGEAVLFKDEDGAFTTVEIAEFIVTAVNECGEGAPCK